MGNGARLKLVRSKLGEPDNSSTCAYQAIWLCFIFGGRCLPRWNRSGLFRVRPDNSHCPALTVEECWKQPIHYPKTDIVVAVGGRFMVAVSGTTVCRIIVPGAAPFFMPVPISMVEPIGGIVEKNRSRSARKRRRGQKGKRAKG